MANIGYLDSHDLVVVPEHHEFDWDQVPPNVALLMDALVEKKIVCCPGYNLVPDGYDRRRNAEMAHDAKGYLHWQWKRHAYGDYVNIHYGGRLSTMTEEVGKMMQLFCHSEDIDYEWDGTSGDAFSIDPGFGTPNDE